MATEFWISLTLVCLLGAMSPGPSLAVIVGVSMAQGRLGGVLAALAHGMAIMLFALVTVLGLVVVLQRYETAFQVLQLFGCLYLVWMAIKLILFAPAKSDDLVVATSRSKMAAAGDGFIIALLNPKIIIFFTALFSQLVSVESQLWERWLMALVAGAVDAVWYMLVAVMISHSKVLPRVQSSGRWLNKIFGLFLLFIIAGYMVQITGGHFLSGLDSSSFG